MHLTNHAKERLKTRCGLPKKALERNARKALEKGIRHNECSGKLRKYLDYLFLSHKNGTNIRIYGNHTYIFSDERLVTVLSFPNSYRSALDKAKRRRNERTYDLAHT